LKITTKLKEEAMTLNNLRHNNIIQFSGVLWSPPDFGIAMPLMPYGSLSGFLAKYDVSWLAKVNVIFLFLRKYI
jgi:hypothetical protein